MGVPDSTVFCLALATAFVSAVLAAPDHFDQRQTGQYNVRIQLKELKIVAVAMPDSEGEGDYDEGNYDYEDPVDPMEYHTKSTTAKSTTTSTTKPTPTKSTTKSSLVSISSVSENVENDSLTTASSFKPSAISSTLGSLTTDPTKNTSENNATDDASTMSPLNNSLTTVSNGSISINEVDPAVDVEEINSLDSITTTESITDAETSTPVATTTTEEATTKRMNNKYDPTKRIRSRVRCRPGYSKDRAGRCRKTRINVKPVAAVVSH